jgi:hypothetical protein
MKKNIQFFYVYLITNVILNKQYIGSRLCYKNKIEDDIYWSSSKYVKMDIKTYGIKTFTKKIIKDDYKNAVDMLEGETENILKYNTLEPNGYNRSLPGENIKFYTGGNHLSKKTKEKISIKLKGKKRSTGMFGKKHTEESKRKMSESLKKQIKTKEHKIKLSKSLTGIKRSEETRKKMSSSKQGISLSEEHKIHLRESIKKSKRRNYCKRGSYIRHKKDLICPHCGKLIAPNMYMRWHGDNCKNNILLNI